MAETNEAKVKTVKEKNEGSEIEGKKTEGKKQNDVGKMILDYIDKGVEVSQQGFRTASKAISDFGDISVLTLELRQLKANHKKAIAALGVLVYERLSASESAAVNVSDEGVCEAVKEISKIRKDIKKHETALRRDKKDSESKESSAKDEDGEEKGDEEKTE